jgi:hypothetical protein
MSKLVGLCQKIKVVIQPKDAQRSHQHAETDGEVATLKALERRSGYADPLGHLGRGNAASLPSKAQALAERLCLPHVARVWGDRPL